MKYEVYYKKIQQKIFVVEASSEHEALLLAKEGNAREIPSGCPEYEEWEAIEDDWELEGL